MRNEQQVLKQLLDFANADDKIRVVVLNGSRVNPNAPKDIMQDYDVVYYMIDIEDESYKKNQDWIKEFGEVLNEFWWIQTYIAKGIWRDELPFVKYMFDVILVDCIRKLLSWNLGLKHDWSINVGKCGRWFKRLLSEDLYNEFIAIYPTTDYEEIWQSLFEAGNLVRKLGNKLSDELGYTYPRSDDINVTEYINKIKGLPKDAIIF